MLKLEKGKSMTPEGRVKKRFNRRITDLFGDKVYRFMPVQTGYGAPALDYFLCAGGWFIAVETKAKGKTPTPRQFTTMENVRKGGGLTFVVDTDESIEFVMHKIAQCLACPLSSRKSTRR